MGFLEVLETASRQDLIRTQDLDQSDIIIKQAKPGKLKDERKWNYWDASMVNYLSAIQGSLGVPLSYVVLENDQSILKGHDKRYLRQTLGGFTKLSVPTFRAKQPNNGSNRSRENKTEEPT